jgi:hypothetical protein
VLGETLQEVGSDWGAAGAIVVYVKYVYGAVPIDPDGAYSQLVTVPDPWSDLLELPIARYLCQKDPGRDPAEDVRLDETLGSWEKETGRRGAYLSYLGTTAAPRWVDSSCRRRANEARNSGTDGDAGPRAVPPRRDRSRQRLGAWPPHRSRAPPPRGRLFRCCALGSARWQRRRDDAAR